MNIKKLFIFLICIFTFTGCNIKNINSSNIEKNIEIILNKNINKFNRNAIGFQYYLPNYMTVKNVKDFNQELYTKGNTFYLYIDIIGYYHKVENNYKINENIYFSKILNYNSKNGYLEIKKVKDKYFIEMMFNYAKIEGYVSKKDLIDSISDISFVLSSIKYNNNIIESIFESKKYNFGKSETYNIFEKKSSNEKFLNWVNEYDTYNGDNSSIESLIEKDEIISDKE